MSQTIELPMTLRPAGRAVHAPAAWFIALADPEAWLAELCAWRLPLASLRLLVVPRSASDRRPCGVLVIAPADASPATTPIAQPYGLLGDKLYIPADARLHPPMSEREICSLLRLDVHILHPTIGLIGCPREELLRVADLIDPPPNSKVSWDRAVAGVLVEPRLRSIEAAIVPTIESIMDDARDGIGTENADELPPLPHESPIRNLAGRGALNSLRALSWIAQHLGIPGKIQRWSAARIESLRAALAEARERELARLMRMLEQNPDEGLRYALPLNNPGSTRGRSPPGAQLPARPVNFNLGSLFRSQPADPWQTSWEAHQRLIKRYRELADRELKLGRFRRAAYIFAHLLNDLASAANALKQGRFYREAATLYRDRLKNTAAAAQCLEEGGLLGEAVVLYEQLGRFETAGDLYRRLQQDDEAESAYRRAIKQSLDNGDTLAAARLLEGKLASVDEALALLTGAWPDSPQAAKCLEESFRLLARCGRHDETARRVVRFRDQSSDANTSRPLADILSSVATTYASDEVRALAADATRSVVGRRLPEAGPLEIKALVAAVTRVAVDDRLLARDGDRYIANRAKQQTPVKPASPALRRPARKSNVSEVVLTRAFHLGLGAQWRTVVAKGNTFYALGLRREHVVLLRGSWDGRVQHVSFRDPLAAETRFGTDPSALSPWLHAVPLGQQRRIPLIRFPDRDRFDVNLGAGCAHFLPPGPIFGISSDEDDDTWVLHHGSSDPNLDLSVFNRHGDLVSTPHLELSLENIRSLSSVSVVARGGHVCVSHDNQLDFLQNGTRSATIDLPRPVVAMHCSAPHTRLRIVVTFDEGACIVWPTEDVQRSFAPGLFDPAACITRSGDLVAVGRGYGGVYSLDGPSFELQQRFDAMEKAPIAVLPGEAPSEFATIYSDGLVRLMRVGR